MALAHEVVRVRAELFRAGLNATTSDGGGSWEVVLNAPRALVAGSAVIVEVSLGAMTDEVMLHGTVREYDVQERRARIALDAVGSLDYLIAVLTGARSASARAHRRITSSIPVNWTRPQETPDAAQSRDRARIERGTIRDISRGGAFIRDDVRAALPSVGSKVEVVLDAGPSPLKVVGVVSWVCEPVVDALGSDQLLHAQTGVRTRWESGAKKGSGPHRVVAPSKSANERGSTSSTQCAARGFGVHFRPGDRETALRLLELVKRHDSAPLVAATGAR